MKIDILRRKQREIREEISKKQRLLDFESQKAKYYRAAAKSLWGCEYNGIFPSSKTPSEKFYAKEVFRLKCSLIFINALITFEKIKAR